MKKIILLLWAVLVTGSLTAQPSDMQGLFNTYLDIKNALVNSDSKAAAVKATDFVNALNSIDTEILQQVEKQAFTAAKNKILKAAQTLAGAKDIEKQRVAFGDLSQPFWVVIKVSESITQPVYYDYCPMKKAYWLSADATIKNPYYGAQMLTCGNVAEKLNP